MSIVVPMKEQTSLRLQSIRSWLSRQLEDEKPKGSIATLDGVRALAFLIVLVYHMTLTTKQLGLWNPDHNLFIAAFYRACSSGVTLFFVLSGFLLFLPYTQALLLKKAWPEMKLFYLRRILRIFPAYFFSLFVLLMFFQPAYLQPGNWEKLLSFLTFTMNFQNSQAIDGPYWTLAVEFQYYMLLPFLSLGIYGLTRLVRTKQRLWVVVGCLFVIIAWGLGTRRFGAYYLAHPQATFLIPRTLLDKIVLVIYDQKGKFLEDFAVGMLIAVLSVFINNALKKERYLRMMQRLSPWLISLCLLLFAFAAIRNYHPSLGSPGSFERSLFNRYPWMDEFSFALSYGCGILAVLFNRSGGLLRSIFEWTPLRWLGLITYSLYIWHIPIIGSLRVNVGPAIAHLNHVLAFGLFWVLVLVIIIPFAFVSYTLIEKPGLHLSARLRQQLLARRIVPQGTSSSPGNLQPQEELSAKQKDPIILS